MIATETRKDNVLSQVLDYTRYGWPENPDAITSSLKPYYDKRWELGVNQGCVNWGIRVLVPSKLRQKLLEELHESHVGIVRMKNLARSYFWWPGLDKEIEKTANGCVNCQLVQKKPGFAPLHPWVYPTRPWERIHIDFAGPYLGRMYFVVIDAYSKWPEVIIMNNITSGTTITVLREIFARYGVCDQLVSDNGPSFCSAEFQKFLTENGIKHIRSAPYHPASNGAAERFVQTLKNSLKAAKANQQNVAHKLSNFLLSYRRTPNSTTMESPAKLFLGREIKSRLDLIKPDLRKVVVNAQNVQAERRKHPNTTNFDIGQAVWARHYTKENQEYWLPATITHRKDLNYEVETLDNRKWKRHLEQLRKRDIRHDQNNGI